MSAPGWAIEEMRPADLDSLAAMVAGLPFFQGYGMSAKTVRTRLAEALADPRSVVLAARLLERPIGVAWLVARGGFDRSGYLRLLAVEATAQGQGVGQALVAAIEAEQLSSGGIFVLVTQDNGPARAFYERLGYTQVGALPAYVLPDRTECVYFGPERQAPGE